MLKEYLTIKDIVGPLLLVEGVNDSPDELAGLELEPGWSPGHARLATSLAELGRDYPWLTSLG